MAGRGSGIGMSALAGAGYGTSSGGVMGDVRGGTLYSGKSRLGVGKLGAHHWLWVLVALEVGILVLLRVQFRRYHGG